MSVRVVRLLPALTVLWTPRKSVEVLFSMDGTRERQEASEYQAVSLTTPANIELYQRLIGLPKLVAPPS